MILDDLRRTYWYASAFPAPPTHPLDGEIDADVVVIGGGYTGLSTALHVAEVGRSCVVLEAGDIGQGASGRNNGQVIPTLSRADPSAMRAKFGDERGRRFGRLVADSAAFTFDLIRRHDIRCAAEQSGWVQPAHSPGRMKLAQRRVDEWTELGAPARLVDRDEMAAVLGSERYFGGWTNPTGGHINPLGLARGLATAAIKSGAQVFTGSAASGIGRTADGRWRVATERGAVRAGRVVLATNAYSDALWPGLKQSVVPVYSLQLATKPLSDNVRRMVIPGRQAMSDTRGDLHFARYTEDNRLVAGGALIWRGDIENRLPAHVGRRLEWLFPQLGPVAFDYQWAGYVGMTTDLFPRLHVLADGVFAWIGCNGRGVALATAMGRELAAAATGADPESLALPATPLRGIPLHPLAKIAARGMLWLYRRRDAKEI